MTILFFAIVGVIVILDQLFKFLAVNFLKPIGAITIINGLLDFVYTENRGAAFGIFANQRWIFIIFTIVAIVAIIYFLLTKKINDKLLLVAASLVVGGGIGNFIDRVFLGYVIDYIELSFFPAICNFADYCISAGFILFIIYIFFKNKDAQKS